MRILVAFEIEIDEGSRSSTGFRRTDQIVRTIASYITRLRFVRALGEVTVCDTSQAELLRPRVRYSGPAIAAGRDELPVGIPG